MTEKPECKHEWVWEDDHEGSYYYCKHCGQVRYDLHENCPE